MKRMVAKQITKKHVILTDFGGDCDAVAAARGGPRDCGGATEPLNVSGYVGAELGAPERGSEGQARLLERLLSFSNGKVLIPKYWTCLL